MKRVAIYLKEIAINEGIIFNSKPGYLCETLCFNNTDELSEWRYILSSDYMQPKEVFNVAAADKVKITKFTRDETDNTLYDLGETFTTDKLITIRVRGFTVLPVMNLNKVATNQSVAIVDIEF